MLYNCNCIDIGAFGQVVNEIELYVTERLSEIAFNSRLLGRISMVRHQKRSIPVAHTDKFSYKFDG